jgi:hypothetical protein
VLTPRVRPTSIRPVSRLHRLRWIVCAVIPSVYLAAACGGDDASIEPGSDAGNAGGGADTASPQVDSASADTSTPGDDGATVDSPTGGDANDGATGNDGNDASTPSRKSRE